MILVLMLFCLVLKDGRVNAEGTLDDWQGYRPVKGAPARRSK